MFILDVAGDPLYSDITEAHMSKNDAAGIIICFDVTNQASLKGMKPWMSIWKNYEKSRPQQSGLLPVAIVGLKTDLINRRVVTVKQGESLVKKLAAQSGTKNIKYFEATCRKPQTVKEVYDWMGNSINTLLSQQQTQDVVRLMDLPTMS